MRLGGLARQQQPQSLLRVPHAAAGVDARREHECDLAAVDDAPGQAGDLDQRPQPDTLILVEALEAEARQHAILAHQRDHVGDRADRDHVEVAPGPFEPAPPAQQRLDHLERHADAGQGLERVAATHPVRVDHRDRAGQHLGRLVVVGDHDVDAECRGARHRLDGGDAAIDGDDQRATAAVGVVDRVERQPVAVAGAVRNPELDLGAQVAQRRVEQIGRGDAVHVVIAVHQDPLAVRDPAVNAFHGAVQVEQRRGIVQVLERRLQEPARVRHRHDASIHQRVGRRQRRVEIGCQRSRPLPIVARMQHPLRQDRRRDHVSLSTELKLGARTDATGIDLDAMSGPSSWRSHRGRGCPARTGMSRRAVNMNVMRDTSGLSQKFVGIRTALHPARLRCSSSTYLLDTTSSSRLAGRAQRRPRCDNELLGQDTSSRESRRQTSRVARGAEPSIRVMRRQRRGPECMAPRHPSAFAPVARGATLTSPHRGPWRIGPEGSARSPRRGEEAGGR